MKKGLKVLTQIISTILKAFKRLLNAIDKNVLSLKWVEKFFTKFSFIKRDFYKSHYFKGS